MKRKMVDVPQVWSWGANADGQLGLGNSAADGQLIKSASCVTGLDTFRVLTVSHGSKHTVYLSRDGTVHTCGFNDNQQLGRSSSNSDRPSEVIALQSQVVRCIAAGGNFSVAINEDGQVFSWGSNSSCQLGREGSEASVKIVRDLLQNNCAVCQISCGIEHVITLSRDSSVMVWGSNSFGQLGIGPTALDETKAAAVGVVGETPKQVASLSGLPVKQVCAGGWHSMLLSCSGAVYAWGSNDQGQLGIGKASCPKEPWPVQVRTLRSQNVVMLACGERHSAALTEEGGVFTFGSGEFGQLGHGGKGNELLPRKVFELMGTKVVQIACGRNHTLALAENCKKLYAFGLGGSGQLGTGNTADRIGPVVVDGPWNTVPSRGLNGRSNLQIHRIFCGGDHSSVTTVKEGSAVEPPRTWNDRLAVFDVDLAAALESVAGSESLDLTEKQRKALETCLSSVGCLCASFLVESSHFNASRNNSGVNLDMAAGRFSALKEAAAKHKALQEMCLDRVSRFLLPSLRPNFPDVEALRVFLLLPSCHLFEDVSLITEVHTPYALAVIKLAKAPMAILRRWWSVLAPRHFGRVVRFFKAVVVHLLTLPRSRTDFDQLSKERSIRAALDLLKVLNDANTESGHAVVPFLYFYIPELTEKVDIEADFLNWVSQNRRNPTGGGPVFSFCSYPFIFDGQAKSVLLRLDARLQMQNAVRSAQQRNFLAMMSSPVAFLGVDPVNPLLVLTVRRDNLIQDTLNELSRHHEADFKKPLKVVFSEEEAVDEGGPTKEFLLLILREILSPVYGMFKLYEESNFLWFNSEMFDSDMMYYTLIGVLCGLAIYNNIVVDLCFPLALFKLLLSKQVTLEDLKELEPVVGRSLQDILDYDGDDFEDVYPLDFQIQFESYGTTRQVELKENGAETLVTVDNRAEYVQLYVQWVFETSCATQFKAFSDGFHKVCGGDVLNLFQPAELQAMVVGNEDYDWSVLEAECQYKGEYWANHPTIKMFWEVFRDLGLEQKKKFLQFLTGCAKVPIYGMKAIKITIQPTGGGEQFLPVAHTCYNLLDLPKYTDKDTLKAKLTLAIEQTEGFALV